MLFLLVALATIQSQNTFGQAPLSLDEESWNELREGKDYAEKPRKKPDPVEEESPNDAPVENVSSTDGFNMTGVGYILLAVVGLLLLAAIIILVSQSSKSAAVTVNRKQATSMEEAEDELPEVELTDLFQEQIDKGEYKLALRVKFLMILQALIDQNHVSWHKRKTNQQYAIEIQKADVKIEFQIIASQFDFYWYGDKDLDKQTIEELIVPFNSFINKLKPNE